MTKEQWDAIQNRDASFDGKFWYGSKHSSSVCRPSCRSRLPKPEYVIIFNTLDEALSSGRHPCHRCRPDLVNWQGTKVELVQAANRLIEQQYVEKFSLDSLASQLFINKNYLVRTYKEVTGNTLLWYHNYIRCEHAKELLTHINLNITEIAYQTGYNSSAHFSRVFQQITGKSPTSYRKSYLNSISDPSSF